MGRLLHHHPAGLWGAYGWFFGVAIAAIAYYAICMAAPKSVMGRA
jgi:cytosine/uracil/thiamine/allantoin permease